ncbi:GIN domain-containing protein [Pedobacter sp. NJ-S-72]
MNKLLLLIPLFIFAVSEQYDGPHSCPKNGVHHNIAEQRYTSYGESEVKALAISGKTAKATLYGEAKLNLNVSDEIKVTAYGEAKVGYKGNPQIRKGLSIGGVKIYKID